MAAETPFLRLRFPAPICFPASLHGPLLLHGSLLLADLADELSLSLLQLSGTPASIPEQGNSLLHISAADNAVLAASRPSQNSGGSEQLQSISQTDVHSLGGQLLERLRAQRRPHSKRFRRGAGLFCQLGCGWRGELKS